MTVQDRDFVLPTHARHSAAQELIDAAADAGPKDTEAPTPRDSLPPGFPPRAAYGELPVETIAGCLAAHGCLHLTGVLSPTLAGEMAEGIEKVLESADARYAESRGPEIDWFAVGDEWYSPFIPKPSPVHAIREWVRLQGAVFAADSPRLSERWFEMQREIGVHDLISRLFDEPPVTSLDKCTLRRVRDGEGIEWHQDGAFLGMESGALNLWVTMTATDRAPGLELLGRPFGELIETGTGGASYDWSIGPEVITSLSADAPIARPSFAAGDGLLFDGRMVHRTEQGGVDLTEARYAIETWFFRPSRFPAQQEVPLAL